MLCLVALAALAYVALQAQNNPAANANQVQRGSAANQTQQNLSPWINSGTQANNNLSYLLGLSGGSTPSGGTSGVTSGGASGSVPGSAPQPSPGNPNPTRPMPEASAGVSQSPGQPTQLSASTPTAPFLSASGIQPGATVSNPGTTGQPITPVSSPGTSSSAGVGGYGSLITPYQDFTAPTALTEQNDPGYQARLALGTDAIQRSAAAKGNLVTGGTAKALDTYGQDYASNEYGNVYNRALQGYQTNSGNYYTGQNNAYNRLMGVSSQGQQTAETAGTLGQSAATNASNTLMQGAGAVNQQNNNAAAATASGYAAQGNILGNAVSGAGNNFGNLVAMQNASSYNPYHTLYSAQNPNSQSIQTSPSNLSNLSIPSVPYQNYQF